MRRGVIPMLVLVALVLGVVNPGARSTATRTVTVQVLGKGTVKSSPSGISCGGGSSKCFAAFSDATGVVLTAKPGGGFAGGTWWRDWGGSTAPGGGAGGSRQDPGRATAAAPPPRRATSGRAATASRLPSSTQSQGRPRARCR